MDLRDSKIHKITKDSTLAEVAETLWALAFMLERCLKEAHLVIFGGDHECECCNKNFLQSHVKIYCQLDYFEAQIKCKMVDYDFDYRHFKPLLNAMEKAGANNALDDVRKYDHGVEVSVIFFNSFDYETKK